MRTENLCRGQLSQVAEGLSAQALKDPLKETLKEA